MSRPAPESEAPRAKPEPRVRVLYSAEMVAQRVRDLGLEVARDLAGKRPLFVGVLKGACMFPVSYTHLTLPTKA